MKGLNTLQLRCALVENKKTNNIFEKVLASDEFFMLKSHEKPLFIVNTEPSHMSGEHWISIYVNSSEKCLEIFDSLGNTVESYNVKIPKILSGYRKKYVLYKRVQPEGSEICGHYCLFFAMEKSDGIGVNYIENNIPSPTWIKYCIPFFFNIVNIISEYQCCVKL